MAMGNTHGGGRQAGRGPREEGSEEEPDIMDICLVVLQGGPATGSTLTLIMVTNN